MNGASGNSRKEFKRKSVFFHVLQALFISNNRLRSGLWTPNSSFGNNGQTVQDQLNQIAQQRATIKELVQQAEPFMPMMSDQDILNYENRRRAFGEVAALQWVVSKYGQH